MNVTTLIKEGLICPECLRQFSEVDDLFKHHEREHKVQSGGGIASGSFKGFIDNLIKPKQSGNNTNGSQSNHQIQNQSSTASASLPTYNDFAHSARNTPLGTTRSHFEIFKDFRSSRNERYAAEGNKLVIRLFKLLNFEKSSSIELPSSFTGLASQTKIDERRAHERSVVEWVDEKQVNRCPDCALPFKSLLPVRRKHHCRFCGSVLCGDCSRFISLEQANILTARMRESSSSQEVSSNSGRRNSSVASSNNDISFRACYYCFILLEQQRLKLCQEESSKGDGNNGNSLASLYDQLQNNLKAIDCLTPDLVKIAESLNKGESLYSVHQGNEVRSKLIKLTESIDLISKRIACLAVVHSEAEKKVNHSLLLLQQRIRQSSIVVIRDVLGSLPIIPTEDEIKRIKSSVISEAHGVGSMSPMIRRNDAVQVEVLEGWSAGSRSKHDDSINAADKSNNPILQQIENVKFYIEQAKAAQEWDSVITLQQSLEDLERELEFVKL